MHAGPELHVAVTAAFAPQSRNELKAAVGACIRLSPVGNCSAGPHGPIGSDMNGMFYDASVFNQDLSKWEVSAVTDMGTMFHGASAFNQDLSVWDVSAVTNMTYMFDHASAFNQDLSKWDVSAVTDMRAMFYAASAFNQDLSKWDVSAVTDMRRMFSGASAFKRELCGVAWVNSKTEKYNMFTGSPGSIASTVCTTTTTGYAEGYGYD